MRPQPRTRWSTTALFLAVACLFALPADAQMFGRFGRFMRPAPEEQAPEQEVPDELLPFQGPRPGEMQIQPPPATPPATPSPTPTPPRESELQLNPSHEACTRIRAGSGVGTGWCFYVDEDGAAYILSNQHVAGRKGKKVQVDFWREGKLQKAVPGVVVRSEMTEGYVDGAVVRVAAEALAGWRPTFVPVETLDEEVVYDVVVSRGCPGGTWQTEFVGNVFEHDERGGVIRFYPRPGGGRSGSSMISPRSGKIVALIAWSTDKPNHENHGTDGVTNASGHGIAMTLPTIWRILRGTVSHDNDTPRRPMEQRLSCTFQDPQMLPFVSPPLDEGQPTTPAPIDPQIFWVGPRHSDPQDWQFGPPDGYGEDDAALRDRLRRERQQEPMPEHQEDVDPEEYAGRFFNRDGEGRGPLRNLIRFVVFAFAIVGAFTVGTWLGSIRRVAPLVLVAVMLAGGSAQAQDYDAEMASLADRWSVEAVAAPVFWMPFGEANEIAGSEHSSLLVVMTMPGCVPCEQLKTSLEWLDAGGFLNRTVCAQVDSQNDVDTAAKLQATVVPEGTALVYPMLVVWVAVEEPTEEGQPEVRYRMHTRMGNAWGDGNDPQNNPSLQQWLVQIGVR